MNDTPKTNAPGSVKIAATLLVAHGGLIVLNAARGSQQTGDWSGLPKSLIWLGVTIVLAGALCERQARVWSLVTIVGVCIGVFNLLQVVGYFMFQSSGIVELSNTFSPALIGLAGIVMLLSTMLLMLPEAKAAFGQGKPEGPSAAPREPSSPPRTPGEHEKINDDTN